MLAAVLLGRVGGLVHTAFVVSVSAVLFGLVLGLVFVLVVLRILIILVVLVVFHGKISL